MGLVRAVDVDADPSTVMMRRQLLNLKRHAEATDHP